MIKYLVLGWIGLLLMACQTDQTNQPEKGIQEIPSTTKVRNSELIHNPITASGEINAKDLAKIEFKELEYDFGQLEEGAVVNHAFAFKNVGEKPLVITSCRSTCGCTIPKWPREPIAPGESGVINVRFNTEGKTGSQAKPITITANTYPADTKIFIKGTVEKKNP